MRNLGARTNPGSRPSWRPTRTPVSLLDDVHDDGPAHPRHAGEPVRRGIEAAQVFERRALRRSDRAEVLAAGKHLHRVHSANAGMAVRVDLDAGRLGHLADRLTL